MESRVHKKASSERKGKEEVGYESDGPGAASPVASGAGLLAGAWDAPKTPPAFHTSFTLGSGCWGGTAEPDEATEGGGGEEGRRSGPSWRLENKLSMEGPAGCG